MPATGKRSRLVQGTDYRVIVILGNLTLKGVYTLRKKKNTNASTLSDKYIIQFSVMIITRFPYFLKGHYDVCNDSSGSSGRVGAGARNMKSMPPPLAAIFFMTNFYRTRGGHGPLGPHRIRYWTNGCRMIYNVTTEFNTHTSSSLNLETVNSLSLNLSLSSV